MRHEQDSLANARRIALIVSIEQNRKLAAIHRMLGYTEAKAEEYDRRAAADEKDLRLYEITVSPVRVP